MSLEEHLETDGDGQVEADAIVLRDEVEDDVDDDHPSLDVLVPTAVKRLFSDHVSALKKSRQAKKARLRIGNVVDSTALVLHGDEAEGVGGGADARPAEYAGDINLQNVLDFLAMIDQRGYERSPHQLTFHNAFIRATSRVIFRDDWNRKESQIKAKYGWDKTPSEIMISTPRRFGKTFRCTAHILPHTPTPGNLGIVWCFHSIAIFCAAVALSFGVEIVVFSKTHGHRTNAICTCVHPPHSIPIVPRLQAQHVELQGSCWRGSSSNQCLHRTTSCIYLLI